MPTPGEHKTVQARILAYAQEIGWTYVPRGEAERRRGFDLDGVTPEARARNASLFFGDLLHDRVRAFNPDYREAETAAVERVVARALDRRRSRGLVWHTQGSGKTYTMIKAAELLFKAPEAEKPTSFF